MNTKLIVSILVLVAGLFIASSVQAQVAISEEGVTFPDKSVQTTAAQTTRYAIGDTGPADGIVFYVTPGGQHGLEAAPVDQSTGVEWGCLNIAVAGADRTYVGAGQANTLDILQPQISGGCDTRPIAASVAADYMGPTGDTVGWFLPSKDELNLMFQNKDTIGGFLNTAYWSSSELVFEADKAWWQFFSDGFQNGASKTSNNVKVRAIRAF